MGQDLILSYASIEEGKEPDFIKLRAWIREQDERGFGTGVATYEIDAEDGAEAKEIALGQVDEVELAWKGDDRSAVTFSVRGATVLVIGGSSWGETPSDAFQALNDLNELGAMKEAGFDA